MSKYSWPAKSAPPQQSCRANNSWGSTNKEGRNWIRDLKWQPFTCIKLLAHCMSKQFSTSGFAPVMHDPLCRSTSVKADGLPPSMQSCQRWVGEYSSFQSWFTGRHWQNWQTSAGSSKDSLAPWSSFGTGTLFKVFPLWYTSLRMRYSLLFLPCHQQTRLHTDLYQCQGPELP